VKRCSSHKKAVRSIAGGRQKWTPRCGGGAG